jgi:hypothetical protein
MTYTIGTHLHIHSDVLIYSFDEIQFAVITLKDKCTSHYISTWSVLNLLKPSGNFTYHQVQH